MHRHSRSPRLTRKPGPILFPARVIQQRIRALAREMQPELLAENLVLLAILRGSFMFFADLVRALHAIHPIRPRIDFLTLSSYDAGTVSSGRIDVIGQPRIDIAHAHVILVDDILDTGRTLAHAVDAIRAGGAATVRTCVLLDKPARRAVPIQADYVGFTIPDLFVVGYGLDFNGLYRECPSLCRMARRQA